MQREEDGDYEDKEGENFSATVDDPYLNDREFKCEKCGKKIVQKNSVLFAPFHCGRQMKLVNRVEHSFDFESIAKRTLEKEQTLFPRGKKSKKAKAAKSTGRITKKHKPTRSKPAKKAKKSKARSKKKRK